MVWDLWGKNSRMPNSRPPTPLNSEMALRHGSCSKLFWTVPRRYQKLKVRKNEMVLPWPFWGTTHWSAHVWRCQLWAPSSLSEVLRSQDVLFWHSHFYECLHATLSCNELRKTWRHIAIGTNLHTKSLALLAVGGPPCNLRREILHGPKAMALTLNFRICNHSLSSINLQSCLPLWLKYFKFAIVVAEKQPHMVVKNWKLAQQF